jgi:hypothetical protein
VLSNMVPGAVDRDIGFSYFTAHSRPDPNPFTLDTLGTFLGRSMSHETILSQD